MASQVPIVSIAILLLISMVTAQPGASLCPVVEPLTLEQAFEKADNVLLGTDVTDTSGCLAAEGGCARRQIQFQVQCVLKQTQDLSFIDFAKPINIGEQRPIRACDRTFFGAGSEETMVIMVTRKDNATFLDWHETNNATRAHYIYGDNLQMNLSLTCNLKRPFDAVEDTCAVGRSGCCAARCSSDVPPGSEGDGTVKVRVWLSSEGDESVGLHCCMKLRAPKSSKWISDGSQVLNEVGAQLVNGETLPVVELTKRASMNIADGERLAIAMYITVTNSTMIDQVTWLAINMEGLSRPDGYLQLNTKTGMTIVNYKTLIPSDEIIVRFRVYKHRRLSMRPEVPSSPSEVDCEKVEDSYIPICMFPLNELVSNLSLKMVAEVTTYVAPDQWSVWTAIKYHDVTPRSACPLINSHVQPFRDTVLCPLSDSSTSNHGIPCLPALSFLLITMAAILFNSFNIM